jgi:hypothetical protein
MTIAIIVACTTVALLFLVLHESFRALGKPVSVKAAEYQKISRLGLMKKR